MERKLDWSMMRKKAEVQDTLARNPSVSIAMLRLLRLTQFSTMHQTARTLRVFVSHTVSEQAWQTGGNAPEINVETGQGAPAWSLKIEGRLLEVEHQLSRCEPFTNANLPTASSCAG